MKTRINFYQKTLRVRRDPVPLSGMISLWLGALLIIAITWAFYSLDSNCKCITCFG